MPLSFDSAKERFGIIACLWESGRGSEPDCLPTF